MVLADLLARENNADGQAGSAAEGPTVHRRDHQRYLYARGRRGADADANPATRQDYCVETGGCPHTAIREDASINLAAVAEMQGRHDDLELVLIESGGDNLSATFSPELADITIYVIDVAAVEEIPRKGGPAITRSDLLVINKTDLAPHVGASLDVMQRDCDKMRGKRPYAFCALRHGEGVSAVVEFISKVGGLTADESS